jgi:hypothetical protein
MPERDVTLTAKFVSTTPVRPAKGDGTSGNPFQITNIGELYWFAAFVNGTASYPDDVTVERSEACAKLMNDITVNYELLKDDGTVNGSSGFAYWIPIGFYSNYSGTFDGQNHTINGLLLNHPDAYAKYGEIGFAAELTSGGCIRDLTIADSLFAPPISSMEYFVGGIVGRMWAGTSVINCHFQGTIRANTTYYLHTLGGIAGCSNGTITDCTSRGWIKGYSNGGAGGIVGNTYGSGVVRGCVNYASVVNELPNTYYGGKDSAAGGIAAVLNGVPSGIAATRVMFPVSIRGLAVSSVALKVGKTSGLTSSAVGTKAVSTTAALQVIFTDIQLWKTVITQERYNSVLPA